MIKSKSGFMIVELLIVIVVIAILAAISIVAYNGIQKRAMATKSVQELASVNKAIQLYYADNGAYPLASGAWRTSNSFIDSYVPDLVPDYISKLPEPIYSGGSGTTEAYMYFSDGINYKLIAHSGRYSELCPIAKAGNEKLVPNRDCWAYGYYSPGGVGY